MIIGKKELPKTTQSENDGKRQCDRYKTHRCTCKVGEPLCLTPEDAAVYHGDIDGDSQY